MKAAVCTKYGPPEVVQLQEVKTPTPKANEVLIHIHATSITASDCIVRGFKLRRRSSMGFMMGVVMGFTAPRNPILGMMLAGEVEAVGSRVKRFQKGDAVFGSTLRPPLHIRTGAHAEYICLPEDTLIVPKPANITYEEAAALPYGAGLAFHFLRKATIQSGQKVLIYGASGSIGTIAVQLAKYFGADVTGVCSTANLGMVLSLGADQVIDYTKEKQPPSRYDLILDAVGKRKSSLFKEQCRNALTPGGVMLSVDDGAPRYTMEDLLLLGKLAETGQVKPIVDRCYPLEQIVEAYRYVEQGHKKGNVVISL